MKILFCGYEVKTFATHCYIKSKKAQLHSIFGTAMTVPSALSQRLFEALGGTPMVFMPLWKVCMRILSADSLRLRQPRQAV